MLIQLKTERRLLSFCVIVSCEIFLLASILVLLVLRTNSYVGVCYMLLGCENIKFPIYLASFVEFFVFNK